MKEYKVIIFPVIIGLINIILGSWSVSVLLGWFGKNIPMWADILCGLFLGSITIPVTIVGAGLRAFGVF